MVLSFMIAGYSFSLAAPTDAIASSFPLSRQ
jgi:hypothetical protein